ncbi:MAG: SurA N-terminal domain-containing protein [Aquificaceae bacterium]
MYVLLQKHKTLVAAIVALASGAFFLWLFFAGSARDILSVGKKCVAEVNGSCVTLRDYRREMLRFSNIQNKEMEEAVKRQVLENLIVQELLYQKAKSIGFLASDDEVVKVIKSDPTFQENGLFSSSKYKELLSRIGLTPEEYEEYIRKMLTVQKLLTLISNGVYLSDKEERINMLIQSTLLSGKLYILTIEDVAANYKPTREEMLSFYEKNKDMFRSHQKRIIRVWTEKDKLKVERLYTDIKSGREVSGYTEYTLPDEEEKISKTLLSEASRLTEKSRILLTKEGEDYVLIYLYKVEPAGVKSFEEVSRQVEDILLKGKRAEMLKEEAKRIYTELKKGEEIKNVRILNFSDTPAEQIVNVAGVRQDQLVWFLLSKEKVFGPYELRQGYGVFLITDRKQKRMEREQMEKLSKDILNVKSNAVVNYFIEGLLRKAKVKVNEEIIKGG